MPVPQRSLVGVRVGEDFRGGVETHGGPVRGVVRGPAGISVGGEGNPGGVHGVGEWLRRFGAELRGERRIVESVEDERDLDGVPGAEAAVEGGRLPGEFVEIAGAWPALTCFGETDGRKTVKPVG